MLQVGDGWPVTLAAKFYFINDIDNEVRVVCFCIDAVLFWISSSSPRSWHEQSVTVLNFFYVKADCKKKLK
jgi:hypothetical protein